MKEDRNKGTRHELNFFSTPDVETHTHAITETAVAIHVAAAE